MTALPAWYSRLRRWTETRWRDIGKTIGLRELFFRIAILLKGLDGALEIFGGAVLLTIGPASILRVVAFLTQGELAEDPHDLVANYALQVAQHLSISTEHFAALYLLIHGAIKLVLVGALLRGKIWVYPVAIIVFAAFIAYQLYRFTLTHSVGLIALSIFDLVVISLVWVEYQHLRSHATGAEQDAPK